MSEREGSVGYVRGVNGLFCLCAAVELFFGGAFFFSWIFGLGRTMGGAAAVSVGLSASSTSTAEYRGRRVRQKHSIVRTTRLSMAGGWGRAGGGD